MKKRAILLAACLLLISVSVAQALPTYQVDSTPGRLGSGGPFQITQITGGALSYQSYCVETAEYITIGGRYWGTIDSLVYYSSGSSATAAPISIGTTRLYNYFIENQASLTAPQKEQIQLAIWALQSQAGGATNVWYTNAINDTLGEMSHYMVKALNLWTTDIGGPVNDNPGPQDFASRAQSMLYITDIPYNTPEPGVLILLGLGLIGVVGIKKKFKM
jgi:hypothetical protein